MLQFYFCFQWRCNFLVRFEKCCNLIFGYRDVAILFWVRDMLQFQFLFREMFLIYFWSQTYCNFNNGYKGFTILSFFSVALQFYFWVLNISMLLSFVINSSEFSFSSIGCSSPWIETQISTANLSMAGSEWKWIPVISQGIKAKSTQMTV